MPGVCAPKANPPPPEWNDHGLGYGCNECCNCFTPPSPPITDWSCDPELSSYYHPSRPHGKLCGICLSSVCPIGWDIIGMGQGSCTENCSLFLPPGCQCL
ncbi:unnamed protein product [Meganyctiphanes norvegica]|uniref:Uncharacterized protein n=1 Tax=Meganyctiphanes norvegica TaxID=48144 RepID=A0AAV2PYC2_MEGNR